jgi:hypothetical protein
MNVSEYRCIMSYYTFFLISLKGTMRHILTQNDALCCIFRAISLSLTHFIAISLFVLMFFTTKHTEKTATQSTQRHCNASPAWERLGRGQILFQRTFISNINIIFISINIKCVCFQQHIVSAKFCLVE